MRSHDDDDGEEEPLDAVIDSIGVRFMVLFSLALLLVTLAVVVFAGERPDFTGEWRLNREQSDNFQGKVHGAISQRETWLDRLSGGIFGSREEAKEEEWSSLEAQKILKIVLEGSEVHIRGDNDQVRTLHTDGRKYELQEAEGRSTFVTTQWIGQEIVSVSESPGGMRATTFYEMGRGGIHMFVSLHLQVPQRTGTIYLRYIYDYVAPPQGLAP
jgi:hypothetical protein